MELHNYIYTVCILLSTYHQISTVCEGLLAVSQPLRRFDTLLKIFKTFLKFFVKVMICKFEILNKKVGSPLSKKIYTHRNMGYFQEFLVEN